MATKGLRARIYPTGKNKDVVTADKTRRIQIRLSEENYLYLDQEAKRTATNMSALASVAVADWIKERKGKEITIDKSDITRLINDPATDPKFREYLMKLLK